MDPDKLFPQPKAGVRYVKCEDNDHDACVVWVHRETGQPPTDKRLMKLWWDFCHDEPVENRKNNGEGIYEGYVRMRPVAEDEEAPAIKKHYLTDTFPFSGVVHYSIQRGHQDSDTPSRMKRRKMKIDSV